uniref:BESS domain-containing protein n=1 Tax=Salarias fasciatus TaxID=181472 RepID=A0A672GD53_SALFA
MAAALILSVFKYPELYNVTLPNYRCTESRASAWRSISSELGLSREYLFLFITSLLYLKEIRTEIKSKKQGEVIQSKWKYRQLMNFIAPFTGSRSGVADICGNDDDQDTPDMDSVDGETSLSEVIKAPQSITKIPVNNGASFPARPRDEDELFLLSFVPALKRLAPQKRCETKMKIQQIMYEAEFNVAQSDEQKLDSEMPN